MLYFKMIESRKGAAGFCRAGHVISAEAGSQKAETLLAYVEKGAAKKLTEKEAKEALASAAETSAPVAEGEKEAIGEGAKAETTKEAGTE